MRRSKLSNNRTSRVRSAYYGMNAPSPSASAFSGGAASGYGVSFPSGLGTPALQQGASYASSWLGMQSQQMLHGGYNPMGQAQLIGQGLGTVVGGGLGFLAGGVPGAVAGAGLLSQVFGSVGSWMYAPDQARANANIAIAPFLGAYSGPNVSAGGGAFGSLGYFTTPQIRSGNLAGNGQVPGIAAPRIELISRFQRIANIANERFDGARLPEFTMSVPDVAATFGQVASGLFAGGLDPMQMMAGFTQTTYPWANYGGVSADQRAQLARRNFSGQRTGPGWSLQEGYVQMAMSFLQRTPVSSPAETLAEQYTRRLSNLFGKTAPDVAKQLAPLLGSLPETGNNTADILSRFGPELTATYGRIQNDSLTSAVDPMTLSRTSARMRGAQREAAIGSLSARGSGALMESAYGDEMEAIAGLPGGRDSLSYATARARRRGAMMTRYGQEDITNFGIPMSNLETDMAIGQVLPFSPGRSMGMGLEHIRMSKNQIGVLDRRMSDLRSRGELTEADEYAMTQQRNALRIGVASDVANLAMPMMNQMLSMNAGRPGNWRGDAASLAAMRLRGTPIRLFGASDGGQAREQDDFVNQAGAGVANAPYSRTQNLNSGGNLNETNGLLRDIRDALRMRSGGPEMRGATPISRPNDMNQRALYDGAN